MADYVVEPIKSERPLADVIGDAIAAGLTDAEIRAAVAKRKAAAAPATPAGHGRGDELFQPDPGRKGMDDVRGSDLITVGRRLPKQEIIDTGDVDLGKYGLGPSAAGSHMVAGTSFPAAPAADGPEEARGFMRFAASGLAGMAAGGATRAMGAPAPVQAVASGAASGAAPTAMAGGSPGEIARDAGIGAAVPTVGAMLEGAGKAVMASRGAKARKLIEGYGGKVGLTNSGSGLDELDAIPGKVTDADIGAQARRSGEALLAENDRRFDTEGRQPYRAAKGQIDKGQGRNLVDIVPLRRKMIEVAQDPSTDPATRSFLSSQVAEIDSQFPDAGMGKRFAPESWVNGKTSMLWDRANPSKLAVGAGSVQDAKLADVASIGQQMREQGPYGEINAKYRDAKQASGEFRKALGLKPTPSTDESIDERRAANTLARRGQKTTTAGIQNGDDRLADLIAKNPELERTAVAPELLRAKADLQFGLPMHGGLIPQVGTHSAIVHNVNPLAGRVLYNPARGAVPLGQSLQGAGSLTSQFAALRAMRRQHDAAVIQTLFGKKDQPAQEGQ